MDSAKKSSSREIRNGSRKHKNNTQIFDILTYNIRNNEYKRTPEKVEKELDVIGVSQTLLLGEQILY